MSVDVFEAVRRGDLTPERGAAILVARRRAGSLWGRARAFLAGLRHYVSTACHHDRHEDCRRVCKYCDAPCRCECHDPLLLTPVEAP